MKDKDGCPVVLEMGKHESTMKKKSFTSKKLSFSSRALFLVIC